MAASFLELPVPVLMDDAENLIARIKRGDGTAFSLIFEQHHRLVLRFLYGIVGEPGLAEELTQETFLQAYKAINTLKDETKLATWLCGIAKNLAYNALRAARREGQRIEINDSVIVAGKNEILADRQLLNAELNCVISDALRQLDDDKRMVFTLKMLRQMSYEEIAEITGVSIPKLKTDLHRAKAVMRKLIRPYLETSDEL